MHNILNSFLSKQNKIVYIFSSALVERLSSTAAWNYVGTKQGACLVGTHFLNILFHKFTYNNLQYI